MIPTTEARQRIVSALNTVSTEVSGLAQAYRRVLAEDAVARITQRFATIVAVAMAAPTRVC